MPAVGDFFRQLLNAVRSVFRAQPPCATQACPDAALREWRTRNKSTIEQALADQGRILTERKKELARWNAEDRASFKRAFGSDEEATRTTIRERIDRMLTLNKGMTINNFKPADPSKPGRFAYVYPPDHTHTVYLDGAYSSAGRTGADSKAGVLCHEMSHFADIGGTKDKFTDYRNGRDVYGTTNSRQLAVDRPDLATRHADSFEYYVENAP